MTTKFKAILSSTLALALTVGISATAIATNSIKDVDSNPIGFVDSETLGTADLKTEDSVKEYGCLADTLTPFELAALMGEVPEDPNETSVRFGRILNTGNEATSVTSPTMELKKSNITDAYNYWVGNFVLNDGQNIETNFFEPDTFSCYVDTKERSCSMLADKDYYGNYKRVGVSTTYLKYDSNGNPKYEYAVKHDEGNNPIYSVSDGYEGTGKMVEIMFFFTLRGGTGSGSAVAEYAVVHFVNKAYSQSAAFAAEPYSGLIDTYTYIPEEMSE